MEDNTRGYISYNYEKAVLDKLQAVINSYLGHFAKADSYRLQQAIFSQNRWLMEYFTLTDLSQENIKDHKSNRQLCRFTVKPRYRIAKIWRSIIDQYGFYRHYYPDSGLNSCY